MRTLLSLSAVLALTAPPAPAPVKVADAPAPWKDAISRAGDAARVLQEKLQARLARALADGGPVAAVSVCRDEAPRLAAEAGRESQAKVGRTSDRLRNPANAPPDWARAPLAEAALRKASEVPALAVDLGDRLGVLFPIPVKGVCRTCHGTPDAIPAPVRHALAAAYAEDRATGYAEGDFRGFVWVEVPR